MTQEQKEKSKELKFFEDEINIELGLDYEEFEIVFAEKAKIKLKFNQPTFKDKREFITNLTEKYIKIERDKLEMLKDPSKLGTAMMGFLYADIDLLSDLIFIEVKQYHPDLTARMIYDKLNNSHILEMHLFELVNFVIVKLFGLNAAELKRQEAERQAKLETENKEDPLSDPEKEDDTEKK